MEREIFHPHQRPPTMLQERNQQNNRDGWFHFQGNLIQNKKISLTEGMQIRYYIKNKEFIKQQLEHIAEMLNHIFGFWGQCCILQVLFFERLFCGKPCSTQSRLCKIQSLLQWFQKSFPHPLERLAVRLNEVGWNVWDQMLPFAVGVVVVVPDDAGRLDCLRRL